MVIIEVVFMIISVNFQNLTYLTLVKKTIFQLKFYLIDLITAYVIATIFF